MQCHRDTTRKNYYRVWKIFSQFYFKLDVKPSTWEQRITLFVGYLINTNKQSSTIKSYLSALRAVLKQDKVILHEDQFLISSLTKACRLKNDCVKLRHPIQKGMLGLLVREVRKYFEVERNQSYLSLLYQTILSTGYFGLFWIGELTKGEHPVLARDVHVGANKRKFLFILRTSKTHGKNVKPQSVKISSHNKMSNQCKECNEYRTPCPYSLLRTYAQARGAFSGNEIFFVFSDGSPVQPRHVRNCLKLVLIRLGFDHKLYTFHSLRIGRSQDLLKYGLSVETIKKLGRWQSNAVFRYLR